MLLTGRIHIAGVYCETLHKANNLLRDVASLIADNPRILYDYEPTFHEINTDQFEFSLAGESKKRYCAAFSEGRSVRGYTRVFARPQFLLGDDIETLDSPMGETSIQWRLSKIAESYKSLTSDGVFLVLGNDFSEKCALHRLRLEAEEGLLPNRWRVHIYPAWTEDGPLWGARYPAKNISELKEMIGVRDESDWQGNFQQNPIPPDGFIFPRLDPLPTWNEIPPDARGIIYCDPNLSLKDKGDTTAIVSLLYSPTTDKFYLSDFICRSFRDSNILLDSLFSMKTIDHRAIGFDGNVSQESTWTMHVRNWCKIHNIPFPRIEYRRYRVDELAKNIQGTWNECRILLPPWITKTKEGKTFLAQLFAFTGKSSNHKDDAPDALICAYEFIHERKLGSGTKMFIPKVVKDFFNF